MAAGFYLETLNRAGQVLHRYAIDSFPCRIGRAYDADLIIDDPYVDSVHLTLDRAPDGQIRVTAHDARNGTTRLAKGRAERVDGVTNIEPDDRLRIGQTMLRVRPVDFPVAPAIPLPVERRHSPALIVLVYVLMIVVIIDHDWYSPADQVIDKLPGTVLIGTAIAGIWSGLLALVGRVFTGCMAFFRHLLIACAGIAALSLTWRGFEITVFAFGLDPYRFIRLTCYTLVLGFILFQHLRLLSRASLRALFGISMAVASALVASPVLLEKIGEKSDRSLDVRTRQTILPPEFLLTEGVPIDAFLGQIGDIQAQAIRLAEKTRK